MKESITSLADDRFTLLNFLESEGQEKELETEKNGIKLMTKDDELMTDKVKAQRIC